MYISTPKAQKRRRKKAANKWKKKEAWANNPSAWSTPIQQKKHLKEDADLM